MSIVEWFTQVIATLIMMSFFVAVALPVLDYIDEEVRKCNLEYFFKWVAALIAIIVITTFCTRPSFASTPESLAKKEAKKIEATCDYMPAQTLKLSKSLSAHLYTLGSCGGGNHWETYLMLIKTGKKEQVIQVGGKGEFEANSLKINPGSKVVEVHGKFFMEDDPMCCPTQHGAKNYEITFRGLSQLVDNN
jgi:hypothetical protein